MTVLCSAVDEFLTLCQKFLDTFLTPVRCLQLCVFPSVVLTGAGCVYPPATPHPRLHSPPCHFSAGRLLVVVVLTSATHHVLLLVSFFQSWSLSISQHPTSLPHLILHADTHSATETVSSRVVLTATDLRISWVDGKNAGSRSPLHAPANQKI